MVVLRDGLVQMANTLQSQITECSSTSDISFTHFDGETIFRAHAEGKRKFFAWLLVQSRILTAAQLYLCIVTLQYILFGRVCISIFFYHPKHNHLAWYHRHYRFWPCYHAMDARALPYLRSGIVSGTTWCHGTSSWWASMMIYANLSF
jgi:hypothetical protein